MAEVILICGKLCSGKTCYSRALMARRRAVLLSCDELEWALFRHTLEAQYDEMMTRAKAYLLQKAAEIALAGCDVILDWGFCTGAERQATSGYFRDRGVAYAWHYMDISDADWQKNFRDRNAAAAAGQTTDWFLDEGLLQKLAERFQPPRREEMDVWHLNKR